MGGSNGNNGGGHPLRRLGELSDELGADVAVELIELFLEDAPGQVSAMQRAAQANDAEALKRAAHSLKGSSSNLGLEDLSTRAASLERHAQTAGGAEIAAQLVELGGAYDSLREQLMALRDELSVQH